MRSRRAVNHVRQFMGARLRALRTERGMSQGRLGQAAGLSGKFIGEVERGEKSISLDSLYRVARAAGVRPVELTDVTANGGGVPSTEAQKIYALLSRLRPADLRRARAVLLALF